MSPLTLRILTAQILALLLSTGASVALWLPPFGPPLQVSEGYNLSRGPYAAGHRGIDLPAAEGEAVLAPADGVVTFSGTVVDRPVLSIMVDARTVVSFEAVTSELQPGEAVARGQLLGTLATGGHCRAECLHLGARIDGAYVNPMRFFRGRPVLVPW